MRIGHRLKVSSATPKSESAKSGLAQGQNGLSGKLNKSVLPASFKNKGKRPVYSSARLYSGQSIRRALNRVIILRHHSGK